MKKYLHLQIALSISLAALLIASVSSVVFYQFSYDQELSNQKLQIEQLLNTVMDTAAIAAYLNHKDMATEVVSGLAGNSVVAMAVMSFENGEQIISGSVDPIKSSLKYNKEIFSPFSKGVAIGEIIIFQDQFLIEQRARKTALVNAFALGSQALLVAIISMLLIFIFLTKPIKTIAGRLHKLHPGSDDRLDMIRFHSQNEIATLVQDINSLLQSAQTNFEREYSLRKHIESLEALYRSIFDQASIGIFLATAKGKVITKNKAFDDLVSKTMYPDPDPDDDNYLCKLFKDEQKIRTIMDTVIREKNSSLAIMNLKTSSDQQPLWIQGVFSYSNHDEEDGLIEGFVFDVTDHYLKQQQLKQQSMMDHLTGLLNRRGAEQKLDDMINQFVISGKTVTLFLMDLDGFKAINDTYGHDAGDKILIEVSSQIKKLLRNNDHFARWGGDEFVLIPEDSLNRKSAFLLAEKILRVLSTPIDIGGGNKGQIGVSIGFSILSKNQNDRELLIKYSDEAMYQVKQQGKNAVCFYDAERAIFEYRAYRDHHLLPVVIK